MKEAGTVRLIQLSTDTCQCLECAVPEAEGIVKEPTNHQIICEHSCEYVHFPISLCQQEALYLHQICMEKLFSNMRTSLSHFFTGYSFESATVNIAL